MTPAEWAGLGTMITTGVTAIGLIFKDRAQGQLSTTEHQRKYIDDQQADITALRRNYSALLAWAIRQIRIAANANVELEPLPSEQQANTPAGDK